jgi:hypothetical protein
MATRSERGQHAGEDLEPEILFVPEPVRATLEHADLVVQPFDEEPMNRTRFMVFSFVSSTLSRLLDQGLEVLGVLLGEAGTGQASPS